MPGWNEMAWFSFFIGVALKSTAMLGVAWLLTRLIGKCSAAARHLVWTAAAASVLALPLLSIALPALRVPAAAFLPAAPRVIVFEGTIFGSRTSTVGAVAPSHRVALSGAPVAPLIPRADWKLWLMLVWAVGAAVALAQMVAACAAVWRMRRAARPIGDRELDLCGALSRALGIHRRVDLLETKAGSMPMTFGVLRSSIFMPSDAAGWSEGRRRIVLLHELAHVRRGDVATHLLARTALSFYWWNPLAWKAWREFLKERERATDDLVLNSGAGAADYAGHLLAVARAMQGPQCAGWAAIAMARPSQLEARLAAILNSGIRRKTPGRGAACVAALAAVAIIAPLAAVRAQDSPSKLPVPGNKQSSEEALKAAEQQRKYDAYWLSIGGKLNAQEKEQQLKDALAGGEPKMDLSLAVEIDHFRVGPAAYFAPVSVELPGSITELAARGDSPTVELDLIGQIQDETGAVAGTLRDKLAIKVDPTAAGESGRKIQYDVGFPLASGKYVLKLLARENSSGKIGTFESHFAIPDLSADTSALKLSSIVWSNQRVRLGAAAPKKSTTANPLLAGGEKIIPNIAKVFRRDQPMYVNFDVYDAMPDPSNAEVRNLKISLSLLDENGTKVFDSGPLDATHLSETRPEAVPVNIEIPLKDIAPGRYTGRLSVVDEAGGKSVSLQTALVVQP